MSRSLLNTLLSFGRNRPPRYRISDTYNPSFKTELNLSVSSFFADEAFHRVFGNGSTLKEEEVLWHFIGHILNRRYNPYRHVVTSRRYRQLIALTAGCIVGWDDKLEQYVEMIRKGRLPIKYQRTYSPDNHEARHAHMALDYKATINEQLEARLKRYFELVTTEKDEQSDNPLVYSIQQISVDLDERGKGHVRLMLDKIIETFQESEEIKYIEISTYDKAKVDLYMHLGFVSPVECNSDDLTGWRLSMPLR